MDKINFTGGFLLHNPKPQKWEKIYNETVPKKRVIINDLKSQGDIFFATSNFYDKSILKYLLGARVKFTFYPNINLKKRISAYCPEEAAKILDAESLVIRDKRKMKKIIEEPKPDPVKAMRYEWKPNDHIQQTITALKLNPEEYTFKTRKSITTITDKNGKVFAKASPNSSHGINYVMVYPRFDDEKVRMLMINHRGEILTETNNIENMNNFTENFRKTVKFDRERILGTAKDNS